MPPTTSIENIANNTHDEIFFRDLGLIWNNSISPCAGERGRVDFLSPKSSSGKSCFVDMTKFTLASFGNWSCIVIGGGCKTNSKGNFRLDILLVSFTQNRNSSAVSYLSSGRTAKHFSMIVMT